MPRFVILQHEMPPEHSRGTHWDLMLQDGPRLRTWALHAPPSPSDVVSARQLDDHRLAYLDFEGHIAGDRGEVRQWDTGQYEVVCESMTSLSVHLNGKRLVGRLTLTGDSGTPHRWTASFEPDDSLAV